MHKRFFLFSTLTLSGLIGMAVFAQQPTPPARFPNPNSAPSLTSPPSAPAVPAPPFMVPAPPSSPSTTSTAPGNSTNGEDGFYLNAVDTDIREIIKQISKATGKNFLIDDKIRGKITILSEKKMSTEEAYQAFLSALEVLGFTVVNAPGDLVKIIPLKEALESPLPIYKENSPLTDSFITRLINLKNVSALDIAQAVKPLISKEGNLFAYPATNTLIVTDSGTNIDRLLKIIREMDTQGPEQVIEIFTIKNAPAKEIADKIQRLYIEQQQQGASATPRRPTNTRGPELDESPYISKVIPDDRTNSILVLASKRALPKVRDLISRLDKPLEGAQGKIHVHYLKNAEAKKIADVLAALTSGAGKGQVSTSSTSTTPSQPGQPGRSSGPIVAEFEGGIKISADESTNSLIITSTQKDYETLVSEVIDRLDIPRRQVYVEVIIMELGISKNRDVGFTGQGGASISAFGNKLVPFGMSLGGIGNSLPSILNGAGAAGVISNGTISIPRGDGTNATFSNFGALLTAIQADTNVNILSTPNLLTLDNEEAMVHVGSEEPFPTGSTVTSGGNTSFNVTRQNVGITLKVTPQVNEGDMVKMKIKQEVSSVIPTSTQIATTVGPSTTKREVETVVVAKDQQTVVIGGLIDDKTSVGQQKIPLLGDIPVLGWLFKKKQTQKQKTNILIFLRPYIIRDTPDFLKILEKKVEERNVFVEQNYGKGQQEVIRQSIRSHAAELLEFKKDIQMQKYSAPDAP